MRSLVLNPDVTCLTNRLPLWTRKWWGKSFPMKELAKGGLTMVVVTHEIGFAREVATRIIFMDRGKIVEEGSPSQVIDHPSHPRLKEFFSKVL